MSKHLALVCLLVACGSDGDDAPGVDGPVVPATLVISGAAEEISATGSSPVEGLLVQAFASSDEATPVAMAMTDATGNYSLTITTNGVALDGYLKATKTGLLDTYLYPPEPLVADFAGASLNMISPGTFDTLSGLLCRATQDAAKGTVALLVTDAADQPVAGATIASTPAATNTCYNGATGLPSAQATETAADGVGYLFNVTGEVTVSAQKAGSTFRSHAVTARAGALTTTVIQP